MIISRPIIPLLEALVFRGKHPEIEREKPEFRLLPAIFGSILCPIGLFWFAFTVFPSVPWIVPILAGIPFGCGVVLGIPLR
jgi:hypothetical protein